MAGQHHGIHRADDAQPVEAGAGGTHGGLRLLDAGGGQRHLHPVGLLGLRLAAGAVECAAGGVQGAAGVVQLLLREKSLCHQLAGAAVLGLGVAQAGLGLLHGGQCHRGADRLLLLLAGLGFGLCGFGLGQGGAGFGIAELNQHVPGLDHIALAHMDGLHGGRHFAAHVDAGGSIDAACGHHGLCQVGPLHGHDLGGFGACPEHPHGHAGAQQQHASGQPAGAGGDARQAGQGGKAGEGGQSHGRALGAEVIGPELARRGAAVGACVCVLPGWRAARGWGEAGWEAGAGPAGGGVPCDARRGAGLRNSLRALRALRSDSRSQSDVEAGLRPPTPRLRFSAAHNAPPTRPTPTSGSGGCGWIAKVKKTAGRFHSGRSSPAWAGTSGTSASAASNCATLARCARAVM